jgi:uncharacterized protein YcnI
MVREKLIALGGAVALMTWIAVPAFAHVDITPGEVPADSHERLSFGLEHGCGESPTVSVAIQIPEGVVEVDPINIPGFEVTTESGEYATPVEMDGESLTEGVKVITWTGGPIDAHTEQAFEFDAHIAAPAGTTLEFPTVQTCEEGELDWIEAPLADGSEPEYPAPELVVTDGSGSTGTTEHHHDDTTETTVAETTTTVHQHDETTAVPVDTTVAAVATTTVAAAPAPAPGSSATGPIVAGTVVGVAIFGGAAAAFMRRKRA